MKIFNLSILLSSFFSMLFQILSYSVLTNSKIEITKKKLVSLVIVFTGISFINAYDVGIFKAPIAFLLLLFLNKFIYNDVFNIYINTTVFSYVLVVFIEIIFSVVVMKLKIIEFEVFIYKPYLTLIFTLIINLSSFLICKYLRIVKITLDIVNNITNTNKYKMIIALLFVFLLIIIDFRYANNINLNTYVLNAFILIFSCIIFKEYLRDELIIKKEIDKVDILLNNISRYEKILDRNRINNHELLNNLLLLKSFKNKNSKKYNQLLNDMIVIYSNNDKFIKNLSLLPNGIKGIIYFKLDDTLMKTMNISVNISKSISNKLEKLNADEYIILCRVAAILIDNAIYASKISKDKMIFIDIYKEREYIIFSIENSCDDEVDINNINKKYFSTKGNNRGLGLFIVNDLLSKSNSIKLSQEFKNNYFISKLKIK